MSAGSRAVASPALDLCSQEGDAGLPGKASIPNWRFPLSLHHVITLLIGRSRISSSAGVYCCSQPGPGSCQHPAEGGRKGCSLVTTSWLAGAVALQSCREASKHLGHQGTMVSLPAGVRGPGEVTLTFPCSPVMGVNLPRKLSSPWGSTQKPEEDNAMSCLPCPALGAGSRVQSSQTPYMPLRDPCKCLQAQ